MIGTKYVSIGMMVAMSTFSLFGVEADATVADAAGADVDDTGTGAAAI